MSMAIEVFLMQSCAPDMQQGPHHPARRPAEPGGSNCRVSGWTSAGTRSARAGSQGRACLQPTDSAGLQSEHSFPCIQGAQAQHA